MSFPSKWRISLITGLFLLTAVGAWQGAFAEDVVHAVSGIVKSVDKDSKTIVVKTADGTEQTIKYTDKTTMKGVKDTGKGVAEGSKVTVHYTEAGGEKTATAVEKASKATAKAVTQ